MDPQLATLYDSGTAKFLEDKFIVRPPFFGVLDGVSEVYDPTMGSRLYGGKSGGQKVVEIAENIFTHAKDSDVLDDVLKRTNTAIRKFCESQSIDMNRPDLLPGAAFAFAKAAEDEVEIIQGGDCFAVWGKISGEVGATPNQNFSDEGERIGILNSIIKKYKGDQEKAWREYMPIAARFKVERVNRDQDKKSVVLNGQSEGESLWYKTTLSKKELKTLLLFTDGMIDFKESRDAEKMGKIILAAYHDGGLERMLSRVRDIENKRLHMTHIVEVEATAIAIEF